MMNPKHYLSAALLIAVPWAAVVGCNSTEGDDSPASGGSSSGGSSSGGSAGDGTGGGSGGTTPTCENFDPEEGECGTCEQSLEDFCETSGSACTLPDDLACRPDTLPWVTLFEGCGYVRRMTQGDVGDSWTHVWSETTGELVFYTSSRSDSDLCSPTWIVGEMPDCDDWEEACDGFGGGGAGGEGGEGGGAP